MKKSQDTEWKYSNATIQDAGSEQIIIDVVRTTFKPDCHIRKISKNQYIKGKANKQGEFISDGIVYEFADKENHMRNRRSLRQIFRTLRQLIANNYKGGLSELFVTLTYAEQTNDADQIYTDLNKYIKRLAYKYDNLKYIAIVEPHATGNYHIHLLLADVTGAHLYIPNDEMEKIWGHGFTKTERLEDIDNMGAYFIAYFSNMELTPEQIPEFEAHDDVEYKNGKAYIKGKRLDYYPEHMRIYRHSKNCEKPTRVIDCEVTNALENANVMYSHETKFEQDGREYKILTEQYKKKAQN